MKNIAVLMTGTALAQGLTFAASPILTRLYDPEAFGLLGLFAAAASIIAVIAAWKYELAIVLPEDDDEAVNLLVLSSLIVLGMTGITLGVVAVGRDVIARWMGSPGLAPYLWWLPVILLMLGLYQVMNYWSTRRLHFKRLSMSQGVRATGLTGAQIAAGAAGAGAFGLIGGRILGEMVAAFTLGAQIWREDRHLIRHALRSLELKAVARVHEKFPKYNAPQSLLNAVSQNVPAFLFGAFFSPEVVGFYWFTYRLLQVPGGLIGEAVRKVFYQRASETFNKGESVHGVLIKVTLGLASLALLPALVLLVEGPDIFRFVFGDEWATAGIYARWLIVWVFFLFVNVPSMMAIHILGRQHILLIYEVLVTIGRVLAIVAGVYLGDDVTAIVSFSLVGAFFNIVLIANVIRYSSKHK